MKITKKMVLFVMGIVSGIFSLGALISFFIMMYVDASLIDQAIFGLFLLCCLLFSCFVVMAHDIEKLKEKLK